MYTLKPDSDIKESTALDTDSESGLSTLKFKRFVL